ncbi:CGCGG family rSAM-modified RiPP protein [Salipaludibacillus aurantiacus]|uniref:Putative rSAM target protein, CGCGG family n=1 Tax=Salipaludibacillus aurantiacus TaxID=1601833 RepID=A0A1H9TSS5_9BACI|nr:CGCGG family rSAM-modified RiPP protein [Salipaludibacillus aurantiacus]SES00285.1 putative rSAM target protein, CGCGG family [Salipaludibacillus aurantiacus]
MEFKNWSASLEHGEYAEDRAFVIRHAIEAIDETAEGFYVNLVTPDVFGNPTDYLLSVIKDKYGDAVEAKYIDQCGCGGYVLRVFK